jgi:hypothetical protein
MSHLVTEGSSYLRLNFLCDLLLKQFVVVEAAYFTYQTCLQSILYGLELRMAHE